MASAAETAGTPFDGGKILYAFGSSNSPLSFPANPLLATGIDPVSGGVLNQSVEIYGAPQNFPSGYAYVYSFDVNSNWPHVWCWPPAIRAARITSSSVW